MRACQPLKSCFKVKEGFLWSVCMMVNDENRTWTPLYMEYPSCHMAYFLWLLAVLFQAFSIPLPFSRFFGRLELAWGVRRRSWHIFILLDTWSTLESGPGYLSRGCLVRWLRATILRTTSFFGRGDSRLLPYF